MPLNLQTWQRVSWNSSLTSMHIFQLHKMQLRRLQATQRNYMWSWLCTNRAILYSHYVRTGDTLLLHQLCSFQCMLSPGGGGGTHNEKVQKGIKARNAVITHPSVPMLAMMPTCYPSRSRAWTLNDGGTPSACSDAAYKMTPKAPPSIHLSGTATTTPLLPIFRHTSRQGPTYT